MSCLAEGNQISMGNEVVPVVQPLSKEEIQQGMLEMQQRQNQRIEAWGKTLKSEDFERSWFGRILKQPKRQEVCGIYQGLIDETYHLMQQNKERLPATDQTLLEDRNQFIQAFGYKDNIVDTRMGFNCRIR
ncbi:hypothetical protein [Acinetobacter celticus]